jgi:hypothetical protein
MNKVLSFSVQSDYNFESAMHRLYTTVDPRLEKSGRNPNCMIQLPCSHFVPSLIIKESISPQSISSQLFVICECHDEGCVKCTETMCLFVCTLCNEPIQSIASLHVVQLNGVSNWISGGRRERPLYGDGCGDGWSGEIVRKRKFTEKQQLSSRPPVNY